MDEKIIFTEKGDITIHIKSNGLVVIEDTSNNSLNLTLAECENETLFSILFNFGKLISNGN